MPPSRGMWTNEQEWRDQVVAQLIYLRTAFYLVAFVVFIGLSAPYAHLLGLLEKYTPTIFFILAMIAVAEYWRSHRKTIRIEKRVTSINYDAND